MLRALLALAPSLALAVVEPELDPVRPIDPPDPTSYVAPRALPHPEPPPQMARIRADAFVEAIEEHADRPGETAFRTSVSAFLQHNRKFAEAQADREGLTIEEIEELTYLGLMVQESQRWGDVEELVGRAISDEERAQGETLMHDLNREFKATMRRMVSEGASTAERWRYIRETEARYRTA